MISYLQALRQCHHEEINKYPSDPDRIYRIAARLNVALTRAVMAKYGITEVRAAKLWTQNPAEYAEEVLENRVAPIFGI